MHVGAISAQNRLARPWNVARPGNFYKIKKVNVIGQGTIQRISKKSLKCYINYN